VIGAFGILRVLRFELTWSRGVHHLFYGTREHIGRVAATTQHKQTPNV
jgi:hypothetical protein